MAKNCRGPRILVIGKQPHQIKWTKRRRWSHKLEISLFLSRSRQARVKGFSSGRKNRPLLFSPLPLTGSHKTRRWGWRVEGAPDCASVATRAMERATCFSRVRQLEPALFTAVYLPSLNATPSPIYIYTHIGQSLTLFISLFIFLVWARVVQERNSSPECIDALMGRGGFDDSMESVTWRWLRELTLSTRMSPSYVLLNVCIIQLHSELSLPRLINTKCKGLIFFLL